jgi:undecaprenyl-diphosphatase
MKVEIVEPAQVGIVRSPTDLLRLVIAVLATLGAFILATALNDVSLAITVEVINAAGKAPSGILVVTIVAIALIALLLPIVVLIHFVRRKQWRRLLLGTVASAVAIGLLWLIEAEVLSRFSPPDLGFIPPEWICGGPSSPGTAICVDAASGFHIYFLAGLVAFFSTVVPWLTRKWRRAGWIAIVVMVSLRMLQTTTPPVDEFLVVGLAYAVGAAVLLAFGTPDRRPRGRDIVDALARSGVSLKLLKRADVDARGSTPYFATTVEDERLFVKVLTSDERAADVMFRVTRMFRLKGVGDERPFSSLKRAVEHEAVGSLMAMADGVRTPRLIAVSDVGADSMLMAFVMIDGSSLDSVEPADLTDDVLEGVWDEVSVLRSHRIAHRDLRLANVFLGSDGEPSIIDFGFAELAATDGQLRSDVAELTMSTAVVVGAERSVAAAIAGIGTEAVADASARIEPLALSGATQHALKQHKGLDNDVRAQIEQQTGVEAPDLEDLARVKPTTVLMIIGFALAIYFMIPQLAQTDFGAIFKADWQWLPAILVASIVTYVAAAANLMGSIPQRLPLFSSVLAQFAGTFINRMTPIKVGGMATNVRFLQKNGVELSVAVAGIGVSSIGTAVIHISLLVLFVLMIGRNAGDFIHLPSTNTVLLGLTAVFVLSAIVFYVPFGRKILKEKVFPMVKEAGSGVAQVAKSPLKALMVLGGAFIMIMSYILALWFSLEAFGGGLGFAAIGVVFLAAQALGQAAPTPGGIGAVEAAMIAAMTAMGLDASVAVPTVFLYRIATFWLPVIPGALAFRKLEADGTL